MKKLILTLLTLVQSAAFAGGISGGGGNGRVSAPDDVLEILKDDAAGFRGSLKSLMFTFRKLTSANSNHYFTDPRLFNLIKKLANDPRANVLADYGDLLKFKVQKSPCFYEMEPTEPRDSSIHFQNGNWVLCYSTDRLIKYPEEVLLNEMRDLAIHEISHTIGYSEEEAILIQDFARDTNSICGISFYALNPENSKESYFLRIDIRQGTWDFAYPVGELPKLAMRFAKGNRGYQKTYAQEITYGYNDYQKIVRFSYDKKTVTFPVQSLDGSISVATLRWNKEEENWRKYKLPSFFVKPVGKAEILFDQKKLTVKDIDIGTGCLFEPSTRSHQNHKGGGK